jgi:hypothetical protein
VVDVEETDEAVDLVERVCALDIGKAALTACIRVSHDDQPGHRRQEVREHATTTRSLLDLAARLHAAGVTLVAMEATSDLLEAGVLPAGSRRIHLLAAQRPPRQERPRPPQDRQARCGVAGQGPRAGHVPAQLRAASPDPPAA